MGDANPKKRYGDSKRRVDLVPPALELGAAVSLAEGGDKYGPYNWRKDPVEAMTYAAAIKRHLGAWMDGEDVDPESKAGKLHLEGIAGCIAILLDSYYLGSLIDNRPPKGPAPMLTRAPNTEARLTGEHGFVINEHADYEGPQRAVKVFK